MPCMGINLNSKKSFHPSRYENQQKLYEEIQKEEDLALNKVISEIKSDQKRLKINKKSAPKMQNLKWMDYHLEED